MNVWNSKTDNVVQGNVARSQQRGACLFIFLKCVEGSVLLFHSHSVTTISKVAISLLATMLKMLGIPDSYLRYHTKTVSLSGW